MSVVGENGDQHDLHNGAERGDLPAQAGWHNEFDRLGFSLHTFFELSQRKYDE